MYIIQKMILVEKLQLHPIILGVEKEGSEFIIISVLKYFILFYIKFLCLYSLGCGIGYGYLHRIPIRNIQEHKSNNLYMVHI